MNNKTTSFFELFYGVRRLLLLTFYLVSVIAFGLVVLVLLNIAQVAVPWQVLVSLLIFVASIGGGAFLYVLLELPKIGYDFDKIKNDIASGNIKSPEQFSRRVVDLLCRYFSFTFFSVEYAFIKVQQKKLIASDQVILDDLSAAELNQLLKLSQDTEDVTYVGKYTIKGTAYHLHLIPIYFGQEWLGYIGIFTHQRLWRIFTRFLVDFENNYVDDQLVHVLDLQKQVIQKQFYREINVFSDKIAQQVYTSIDEYLRDIVEFLVSYTQCVGGLFATIYQEDCVTTFTRPVDKKGIEAHYRHRFNKGGAVIQPGIVSDPAVPFDAVFELPIFLDQLQGILLLFDDDPDNFTYFFNTLIEIESIKLHSDLRNLAIQLDTPVATTGFVLA
ncbi:MAG: hypothetical protein R6X32_17100 [Chloroflexota bacterium]